MSADTSPTVWAAEQHAVRSQPTFVGNSFGSLYGGMQGGYNYVFPSAAAPRRRSRRDVPEFSNLRGWLDLYRGDGPGHDRHRPDRLYRHAARTFRLRIRSLARSTAPADLLGRKRASARLPASPAMRTRFCSRAPAGRSASAPSSQSRRAGPRGSNISTIASAPSPASFLRAQVTSRSSTSRRCGSGSTTSSAYRTPTRRRARAAMHGRLHPTTGISTANSPLSNRAIRHSTRRTKAKQPLRRQPGAEHRERDRIRRISPVGRHRHLHQSGDHPGLWAQHTRRRRRLPQF